MKIRLILSLGRRFSVCMKRSTLKCVPKALSLIP
ncbi:unnamed protein product [Amoebophrya sp. A25]|nr:unnamed protein product [Amoebophrya sp. A25]|eukprot:GSA25T00007250001.1